MGRYEHRADGQAQLAELEAQVRLGAAGEALVQRVCHYVHAAVRGCDAHHLTVLDLKVAALAGLAAGEISACIGLVFVVLAGRAGLRACEGLLHANDAALHPEPRRARGDAVGL